MTLDPTVVIAAFGGLVTAITTVARFVYLDLRKDRDFWRTMAIQLMAVNNKSIDVAARDA